MVNVTPKQLGKNVRMSFGKITEPLEMPNLIEGQKNSYQWFREEGLREVFRDMTADCLLPPQTQRRRGISRGGAGFFG